MQSVTLPDRSDLIDGWPMRFCGAVGPSVYCREPASRAIDPTSPAASARSRIPACQGFEQERGVGAHGSPSLDDGIETLEGNLHSASRIDLGDSKGFKELLQEHLARVGRRTTSRQH